MTQRNEDCGCLYPLLPCLYTPSPEEMIRKQHSDAIDRKILKEKYEFKRTHRLLLLGAGESGKSTIIKQMQLIHVEKFSESAKQERRRDIRNNLLDAIVSIISAMPVISPPVHLENEQNQKSVDWILQNALSRDFSFPQEFYNHVTRLWKDKGIQATFQRSNEYQLIDSAQYFLEKIEEIRQDDYMPSEQDILRCRVLTKGIYELVFQINNIKFHMIDVGGQRGERRKWFLCFNDVTAIIFVAASSSFDSVLREDATKNRLQESLDIFKVVWNNRFLKNISVILFLNKIDILKNKIMSGRSKLEDYFPEYKHYNISPGEKQKNCGDDPAELQRAMCFIRKLFLDIKNKSEELRNRPEDGKNNIKTQMNHCCFIHFTCAVDTENIKRVFEDCKDIIQRRILSESDLL